MNHDFDFGLDKDGHERYIGTVLVLFHTSLDVGVVTASTKKGIPFESEAAPQL